MNDPEPVVPEPVRQEPFVKRVLRSAVREVKAVKATPMPDRTPGVRWLRKHRRTGDPKSFTACACKGCQCTRQSRFGLPCHPCFLGRHARSPLSKAARLALAGPGRARPKVDPRRRTPAQRKAARRR